jgi:hypothetical protein
MLALAGLVGASFILVSLRGALIAADCTQRGPSRRGASDGSLR